MSQLSQLRAAENLSDLARLLSIKPAHLSYILYVLPDANKYTEFEIPKKCGGTRSISSPCKELRIVQSSLANLLQNCITEIPKLRAPSFNERDHRVAHGFMRGLSIATNASKHRKKRYVFNIDLNNFFGEINFGRVRGFFINDRNFKAHEKVATIISQIACANNCLPQGSPSSPIISNLIGGILDSKLIKLASENNCIYSRYADDITFSTNRTEFPHDIALPSILLANAWEPGDRLTELVGYSGFSINNKKTRMQISGSRQEVTGLTVNRIVNSKYEYRHTVRAMVHRQVTRGDFFLRTDRSCSSDKPVKGSLRQLQGMLEFISHIDTMTNKGILPDNVRTKTFKRFLFYKNFYAAERPTIIFEGETDSVYITHAIRRLAKSFPTLANTSSSGQVDIKVKRFDVTKDKSGLFFSLNGGSGDLLNFAVKYKDLSRRYSSAVIRSPIIIFLDNDSGCNSLSRYAKDITKHEDIRERSFTHLFLNLYLVLTPKIDGKDSCIEDFFYNETRSQEFEGKTFSGANSIDTKKHFGKVIFAENIIRKDAMKINFSKFEDILSRIEMVIDDFNTKFIKSVA